MKDLPLLPRKRYCRLWEENGKFYLSEMYGLNIIVFNTAEERARWMTGGQNEGIEFKDSGLGKADRQNPCKIVLETEEFR